MHLPLEARDGEIYPGPGTIYTTMDKNTITEILRDNLATVPDACGVSNHMGSKATQDKRSMRIILNTLKKRNLFFLDSYTSPHSVTQAVADECGVSYLRRNVFLDNVDTREYIKDQMYELIARAKQSGFAIGIGHYRENTLTVIKEMLPVFEEEGIKLVGVRELIEERPSTIDHRP